MRLLRSRPELIYALYRESGLPLATFVAPVTEILVDGTQFWEVRDGCLTRWLPYSRVALRVPCFSGNVFWNGLIFLEKVIE
jgi:hypothetical protein